MKDETANFDDDFDDIDEVDAEDGDRGVSGLVVLLMGAVMFGAVASVVWIASMTSTGSPSAGAVDTAPTPRARSPS